MIRLILRISISLMLLALIIIFCVFFLTSAYGLQTTASLANIFVPGLEIGETHGTLANHFELDNIKYKNNNIQFHAKRLAITWKWHELLNSKINIAKLFAENGTLTLVKSKSKFNSSFNLYIKDAEVKDFSVHLDNFNKWINGKELNIKQLKFSTRLTHKKHKPNTLLISELQAFANNSPITAQVDASWKKKNFQINKLNLSFGNNKLVVSGSKEKTWNLNWLLTALELNKISLIHGELFSKGSITGPLKNPNVIISLKSKGLLFKNYQIKNINASSQFGILPNSKITVNVISDDVFYNNTKLKRFILKVEGSLESHFIHLQGLGEQTHFNLNINGESDLKSWKERIENFSFYSKDFGDWHTQNATQLTIFTNTIQLNPICLQSNYKKLCANFMWRKKYGINGKIFLNTDDIRWIANLIPKTDDAKGLLNINLDISGHFKKPIILGHVKLTNASINVPDYNTSIKNIMIIGQGDARGTIDWKGSALVGNNSVYMTGKSFLNQNGYPTKLMIHGDQLTLTNSQSYKIIASPELNLSYIDHVFVLKGAVLINKALIQTNEFEGDSVTLADDIVFIDTKNQEKKSVIQFQSHLNINLGDNAFINIEGINGQVVGKILLHYDPRDMTTAKGEINIVNGQFSAYGRKLKIDKGKLLFTGGKINNPYVDLIASKVVHTSTRANVTLGAGFLTSLGLAQSGEVLVGVNIKGRLKNYQVKLFSQPGGFSDADILSLMLFDRTTNQVTSVKGGQALLNAASQLNLVGGGLTSVTEELQNAFDLEELGLSNESLYNPSTNAVMINPSFTIGKRIGHNLHVSYSIGIFDPISIIRLRYDITPNWNVQTDASVLGRGFDVFYTIER